MGNGTDIGAFEIQNNGDVEMSTELIVSTLEDENDGDFSTEDLSLREAIAISNEQEGADTITFDSSLNGSIVLTEGELSIEDSVTINGLGAENLTIDGNNSSRIFKVDDGNSETDIDVTIDGVTITNGLVVEEGADSHGGGILNQENLTIISSNITNNRAEDQSGGANTSRGGGIYTSGTLDLSNSTVSGNFAIFGGGIYSLDATVNITDSTISDNEGSFVGGGLYHTDTELNLTNSTVTGNKTGFAFGGIALNNSTGNISHSTVSNNVAENGSTGGINFSDSTGNISHSTISGNTTLRQSGGGISVNSSNVDVDNSTISNNTANEYGGGIFSGLSSTTNISNSTISGNFAVKDGSGVYQRPELVIEYDQSVLSGNVNLESTIIAGNVDNDDLGGDGFDSGGNNLIGNADDVSSSSFDPSQGDIVGTADNPIDPKLGELQDNGGATQTIALLEDSPAIDTGSNPNNLETDQRGEGFNRTVGNGTDIGAYEVQDVGVEIPTELIVSTLEDENDGDFSTGDLSLREAIAIANEREGADTITFDSSLNGSIALSEGELTIEDSVTINGLGAENLTIDGNNGDRVFKLDDGNSDTFIDVTLDGLNITNGNVDDRETDNTGGGIFNQENLTIVNTNITGNRAEKGGGIANQGNLTVQNSNVDANYAFEAGGIYTIAGTNQIIDSSISNNESDFVYGGIQASDVTLDIENSIIDGNSTGNSTGGISISNSIANINNTTISNNSADGGSGGISSGGSTTTINNSTINGNSAAFNGGITAGGEGTVTINNSTITGNSASVNQAGGVKNYVLSTMTINNSTITGNSAAQGAAGVYQQKSFVAPDDLPEDVIISGTLNLNSTIVAGNENNQDLGGDSFNSGGNNLIGNGEGFESFFDPSQGDILGTADNPVDPKLGELQDNGGATQTIALLEDSPAIDAGSNPNNLAFDQRGEGFDRTVGNGTDIGAYEVQTISSDDEIIGTPNNDFLLGSAENDTIRGLDGNDFIQGFDGSDFLVAGNGNDFVEGGNGNDSVNGDDGNDFINGGNGDDVLRGGNDHDRIFGGAGADIIDDGAGNDVLLGGAGEDRFLASNSGNDVFTGGSGSDYYVFNINSDAGFFDRDRVLDFNQSEDRIAFRPVDNDDQSFDNFDDLDTNGSGILDGQDDRVQILGNSTVIDFSDLFGRSQGSDKITLIGANNLNSDNFLFNETVVGSEFG